MSAPSRPPRGRRPPHASRNRPAPPPTSLAPPPPSSRGRGRGRGGRADLNANIDGRMKADIWRQMKEFQDDASLTQLPFPPTLSSEDRKYVHKIAINLSFTTKSTGNRNDGSRHVVVYKRAGAKAPVRPLDPLLPLPPAVRALIDNFLHRHPLSAIEHFDPLRMHSRSSGPAPSAAPLPALPPPRVPSSHLPRPAYLSNPRYQTMLPARARLPITSQRAAIIDLISSHQVVVLSGATGCGKSTQVPQFILEWLDATGEQPRHGQPDIVCTQPRRISAISLAERVASERGEEVGQSVGYQIRLERHASPATRIMFCTVGILLRRLVADPALQSVRVLIVDECHERERNCDFLLTLLRDLLPRRRDLHVVLMSATINAALFSDYFQAQHIFCPGFTYPVETFDLADVIELTGYVEGGRETRSRDMAGKREAQLRVKLQEIMDQQLFDRRGEEEKAQLPLPQIQPQELSHDEALRVLEKRREDRLKPVGWVDTWQYQPTFDYTAPTSDEATEASLTALLSGLSGPPTSSLPPPSQPETSSLRYHSAKVEHSPETLVTVARLEESGMDYIDYSLIVSTIHYICTQFASRPGSRPPPRAAQDTSSDVNVENGAILVFLPGWEDINRVLSDLQAHPFFAGNPHAFALLPLHGSIPSSEQRRIFAAPQRGVRKVVLSTNIAETSITIDDVVFVIDCGKMKEKAYDPYSKMSSLASGWISQANAKQRSGRAGRSRPGVCFRLYSQKMYDSMDEYQTPELLRTPLEEVCLQIKLLQLDDVSSFLSRCLQPPATIAVKTALELLVDLGALTTKEELTELGEYLAALPVDPRLGKMILYGAAFQCLDPILTVVSCLAHRDPFVLPMEQDRKAAQEVRQRLSHGSQCDLITLLHAFNGYQQAQATGRSPHGYCRANFLQQSAMSMIAEMKRQFFLILRDVGLLDDPTPSPSTAPPSPVAQAGDRVARYYNERSGDMDAVHAVIVAALYPNAAKVSYGGGKKGTRPALSTRDLLTNVRIHPSSVNNMRDLDPIQARDGGRGYDEEEEEEEDDGGREVRRESGKGTAPWLMYYEVMRSSQVFLRCTSLASPILVSLIATSPQTEAKESELKTVAEEAKDDSDNEDDDEDDELDEDEEEGDEAMEDAEEEGKANDAEDADDGGDVIFFKPSSSSPPPPAASPLPPASSPSPTPGDAPSGRLVTVDLDGFIRYALTRDDAARLHAVRRYLQWLLHQRIIQSQIQVPGNYAARMQQQAAAAAEEEREKDVIALFTAILREDAGSRQADIHRQQAAAPPLYTPSPFASSMYRGGRGGGRGGPSFNRGGPPPNRGNAHGVRVLSPAAPVFTPGAFAQPLAQPVPMHNGGSVPRGQFRGHGRGSRGGGRQAPEEQQWRQQKPPQPAMQPVHGGGGEQRGGQQWRPSA